jgi:hypothetical protein
MKNPSRQISATVTLLLALPFTSVATPQSGIQGRTHIYSGPLFDGPPPAVFPAVVTTFPVAATFTVLSARTGRVVAQASSDVNGNFKVALPPGPYVIVADAIAETFFCSYHTPEPFEVTVRPKDFAGAGFTYIADCHGISAALSPASAP